MSLKVLFSFVVFILALSTAYSAQQSNLFNAPFNFSLANYVLDDSAYYTKAVDLIEAYNAYFENISDIIKNAIGTQTIRLELSFLDGYNMTIGAKTVNGLINEYRRMPYNYSTMVIYLSESAVLDILSSSDPFSALGRAWGTTISFTGLTPFTAFTSFVTNFFFRLFSLFSGGSLRPITSAHRSSGITVNLVDWWHDVPAGNDIQIDPLGGALYMFWLDTDGNICHGTPGVDGQPGILQMISPNFGELRTLANNDELISLADLARLRNGTYSLSTYTGTGVHFAVYKAQIWRERSMGMVFEDFANIETSYLITVNLSSSYITPGHLFPQGMFELNGYDCSITERGFLSVPDMPSGLSELLGDEEDGPSQNPTKCLVRQNITPERIAQACRDGTLIGGFSEGYLRI